MDQAYSTAPHAADSRVDYIQLHVNGNGSNTVVTHHNWY